jgi:hypothetical protein
LNLARCKAISDVRCLSTAAALKHLSLRYTAVANGGLAGLENVSTLEELLLAGCIKVTDVSRLAVIKSLRNVEVQVLAHVKATGMAGVMHEAMGYFRTSRPIETVSRRRIVSPSTSSMD